MSQKFLAGTFLLTLSGVICRVLGFLCRILLSRTIGAENLGLYQLTLPVFTVCLALSTGGIQSAISRYVAASRSKNTSEAGLYLRIGMTASVFLSFICTFVLWTFAAPISGLLGDVRCESLLRSLSVALLPAAIHSCINGYYYGCKKVLLPSLCQFMEQIARIGGILLFLALCARQGTTLCAIHAIWGLILGECAGLIISLLSLPSQKLCFFVPATQAQKEQFYRLALPITCNRLLVNLLTTLENAMIPLGLQAYGLSVSDALSAYGILTGMTLSILLMPNVLTNSIAVLLMPSVSEAQSLGRKDRISTCITKATQYGLLFGFLFLVLFYLGGPFLGELLFQNKLCGLYLQRLGFLCPLLHIGCLLESIIHGLGRAGTVLVINLLSQSVKIALLFSLLPIMGMDGCILAILVGEALHTILLLFSLRCIKK